MWETLIISRFFFGASANVRKRGDGRFAAASNRLVSYVTFPHKHRSVFLTGRCFLAHYLWLIDWRIWLCIKRCLCISDINSKPPVICAHNLGSLPCDERSLSRSEEFKEKLAVVTSTRKVFTLIKNAIKIIIKKFVAVTIMIRTFCYDRAFINKQITECAFVNKLFAASRAVVFLEAFQTKFSVHFLFRTRMRVSVYPS